MTNEQRLFAGALCLATNGGSEHVCKFVRSKARNEVECRFNPLNATPLRFVADYKHFDSTLIIFQTCSQTIPYGERTCRMTITTLP